MVYSSSPTYPALFEERAGSNSGGYIPPPPWRKGGRKEEEIPTFILAQKGRGRRGVEGMQVFEFHFNPKAREDLIFDSFCYEPENIYEKRLGSLYLVGELKNVLPQNLRLIKEIAQVIKEKYYTLSLKSSEKALSEGLKKVNEFLAEEVKKENVSWLGNLSLAILGLTSHQEKWWEINFTKVGLIKVFLLRSGKITEISKNLEFQDIELYPLKVFTNIVSGKLAEGDKILVLTKEVFDFFLNQELLPELAKLDFFEEKKLKEILNSKKPELLKISGVLFALDLRKILPKEIKEKKPIIFQPELKRFSFSQVISPILFSIWKVITSVFGFLKKILLSFSVIFRLLRIFRLREKISPISILFSKKKFSFRNFSNSKMKNLILILLLLVILFLGFFFSQREKEKEIKLAKLILERVEAKKIEAESFLILKEEREANLLLQEAWNEILPQTKPGAPLKKEALAKKEEIEKELFALNKLEKNPSLNLLLELKPQEIDLIPQKVLFSNSHFYFFNPFSSKVYKFDLRDKTGSLLDAKRNLRLGAIGPDSIFFFSNPNLLLFLKDGLFQLITLQPSRADFSFDKASAFKQNIYFLDSQSGEIVKYFLSQESALPQLWLSPETKKAPFAKSMAIDGSIWILTKDNQIDRYYAGFYQETLKLDFWPYLKNPTKIFTSEARGANSYLYLLEPTEKRIIILTKKGEMVKQFQSEEFDNLLDFAISEDGKTIYLLNGLKVYEINF